MSVLESLYLGTSVVASAVGGLNDIVTTDCGSLLVSSYVADEWVAAVNRILHRSEREQADARSSAIARGAELTWRALGNRHSDFYRGVVERSQPHRGLSHG